MSRRRSGVGPLIVLAALSVLLVGAAGAAALSGDAVEVTRAAPDRQGGEVAGGGCCGLCRGASAPETPRCARAGEGGCCGYMARHGGGGRHGGGMGMRGDRPGGGMGMHGDRQRHGRGGRGHGRGGRPAVMETAHDLVHDHRDEIERTVEMVENGVVTVTRAPSSEAAAAAIRRHVREMKQVLESGGRVRMWDPLFREIFAHADVISMEIEELDDGMRVTETSEDPDVARLIQAHARKVTEFIERGPAAVHEETPLPEGYGAIR